MSRTRQVESPVSRHSMQSYTLTYCSFKKWGTLIVLGSHQGGPSISASAVYPTAGGQGGGGGGGGGAAELATSTGVLGAKAKSVNPFVALVLLISQGRKITDFQCTKKQL